MWFRNKKTHHQQSDAELIATYKKDGDTAVVGVLYQRYGHLVYSICYKYLRDEDMSKDAVLNIFEKLFDDLKKYEVTNFSSWIHSVARNNCLAVQQKEKNKIPLEHTMADVEMEQEAELEIYAHLPNLPEAIESINEQQRICIQLFYLEKKSYVEISTQTGYDLNQVKSFIQNGKRNLKNYLLNKKNESR